MNIKEDTEFVELLENNCYNQLVDFDQHDVLEVYLQTHANDIAVDIGTKDEPQTIHIKKAREKITMQIPAMSLKRVIKQYCCSKTDIGELKAIQARIGKQRKVLEKELEAKKATEHEKEQALFNFAMKNNPYGIFRKENGYDLKQCYPMYFMNNLGPRVNNIVAKQEKDRDIYNAILALANSKIDSNPKLIEVLEQNKKLLQELEELKASKQVTKDKEEEEDSKEETKSPYKEIPEGFKRGPFGRLIPITK